MGRYFRYIGGKVMEVTPERAQNVSPYVQDDTLERPLINLATGYQTDSRSDYLRDCKNHGLEVVGNDWLGKTPQRPTKMISEERVLDATEKAESILSDPSKRRAYWDRQQQLTEERRKLVER